MKFNIVKKGYDIKEVDTFVEKLKKENEEALKEQKERIFDLKKQLVEYEKVIKDFDTKKEYLSDSIVRAVEKSNEIEKFTQKKYALEMEQLKNFHNKWVKYYTNIIKKYPLDDCLKEVEKFNNRMSFVVNKTPSSDWLFKNNDFNANINTNQDESENIFSIEEALKPTKDLSEIINDINNDFGLNSEESESEENQN